MRSAPILYDVEPQPSGVRWFFQGEPNPKPPCSIIGNRWNRMLESGRYKVQEADSPYGPWVDAEMRDDGSVWQVQRFIRMELIGGIMRRGEQRNT
jgi:hypothetical protein